MNGLAIFLIILVSILVGAMVVLLVLIVSVSRKIAHAQENVQTLRQRAAEVTNMATIISSVATLVSGALEKTDILRQKRAQRKGSDGTSETAKRKKATK